MTTIHDEEKIEEIFNLAEALGGWEQEKVYNAMKLYAEHIHQKTIDECIACVPIIEDVYSEYEESPENRLIAYRQFQKLTLTNLNQLKK